MRLALIGSGYWGRNLARVFHELGVLAVICDKSEAVLADFAAKYPGVAVCQAVSDALSRPEVTGAVVAAPAETHFLLAREVLLAGKHVFVEKPLALHVEEAKALTALARERGLTLMVGHLLQYHPAFVKLKELVKSGELGRINYIYSHRLNLGKIRREENILWSFAPHDISMILSLAGEMPESVAAVGGNYLHRKIADVTTTHLSFPTGLKAHVFVSWLHPFKEQKMVVVGEAKMAVFDDTLPWEEKLSLYAHTITWEGNMPVPAKADAEPVALSRGEPLRLECDHFLACAARGHDPLTDGEEGTRVLEVLAAAQRSLEGGVMEAVTPGGETGTEPAGDFFVHESAVVDPGAVIGEGTKIWHFSHVLPGSRIGPGCVIGQNVSIGPDVVIGAGCKIQNNVSVYKGVTLEDGVFCGPSMVFTNVFNPRAGIRRMDQLRPTLVRQGATLGANCTVVCGITVGKCAFVGAGAVVTRDVPDYCLVAGNPARHLGFVCACGVKLDEDLTCPECAAAYRLKPAGTGLEPLA